MQILEFYLKCFTQVLKFFKQKFKTCSPPATLIPPIFTPKIFTHIVLCPFPVYKSTRRLWTLFTQNVSYHSHKFSQIVKIII